MIPECKYAKKLIDMPNLDRPKSKPWLLKTPPGTSDYTMHTDEKDGQKILVCTVGKTVLHYDARCIEDLQAMLKSVGDWVDLGNLHEQDDDGDDGKRHIDPNGISERKLKK